VSIKLESMLIGGQTVWIEVTDTVAERPRAVTTKTAKTSRAAKTAKTSAGELAGDLTKVDIARTLSALVGPIREGLKAIAPDEVSVELNLGLKGEVGVFVAKSEGSASLKITAKWKIEAPKAG